MSPKKTTQRYAIAYCIHDDIDYLRSSIESFVFVSESMHSDVFAFISRLPWHGTPGDWQSAAATAEALGATVVLGDWPSEQAQRQAAIDHLLAHPNGYTHALIPDGDEIVEPTLLQTLLTLAEHSLADRVYVHWDTYWKTPEYVIRPRERFTPCCLIDLRVARPTGGRNFEGGRPLLLGPEHGIVHHLSWVGPESRIRRKLETWGHAQEVLPGWYERVWEGWDRDKLMRNIHPTHPEAYGFAERIAPPEILQPALARYREVAGTGCAGAGDLSRRWKLALGSPPETLTFPGPDAFDVASGNRNANSNVSEGDPSDSFHRRDTSPAHPAAPPIPISVIIPVHGGQDDLAACLGALAPLCADGLLRSVVVVDNASPDGSAAEAASYPFVTLIQNDANTGFAHACNQGADSDSVSADDHLLFLNSDAVLTRAGLIRMAESLRRSGSIGAAGPLTNNAGHGQQIDPTYTSLETMPLFADDFAHRDADGEDRDMLVGFCLLVRRSVWEEVKDPITGQGFDERFGLGTFEDNDLCYRIRRAGYRLVLATRAYVHHGGSKTLVKVAPDVGALLERNRRKFVEKWEADLECGFASGLSGLMPPSPPAPLPTVAGIAFGASPTAPAPLGRGESENATGVSTTAGFKHGNILFAANRVQTPLLPSGAGAVGNALMAVPATVGRRGRGMRATPTPTPIAFNPANHPDLRLWQTRENARRADISLCMIVKNEERVLGACLASAAPFFREILVVDTGSTDRTAQIAREHGARVFDFPWTDSFSEARNESIRHAAGKWIFWLDADDTLPWETGEAVLDCALAAPPAVVGFVVPVQFVEPEPGEDGTVPPSAAGTRVDHVKLFRNLPGLAFEGRIHEQILASLRTAMPAGQIARAPANAVVLHTGYDTTPEGQARKRDRDAKLLALDLAERPGHPFVLFNLGMTDHFAGMHETAIDWLRQSITAAGSGESHVRKAYALMAVSLRELGRTDEALAAIGEGLTAVGDADPELHFHAGFLLTGLGRYAEAKAHYEKSADADADGFFSSFDFGILGYKTYHNLGQVSSLMGDYEEAKRWWTKSVDAAPQFLSSAHERVDHSSALAHMERAQRLNPSHQPPAQQVVRLRAALGAE